MLQQQVDVAEPVASPMHEQVDATSAHGSSPVRQQTSQSHVVDAPPPALQAKTCADLPTPATIEKQKKAYLAMLDGQLQQGLIVLDNQVRFQKDYLAAQALNAKRGFSSNTAHELSVQEAALQKQYCAQTFALQEQAAKQRLQLEQQALSLTLMYQQKKAEEEMQRQKYELEQMQREMKIKLESDMKKLGISSMPQLVLSNEGVDQITMSTATMRALPDAGENAPSAPVTEAGAGAGAVAAAVAEAVAGAVAEAEAKSEELRLENEEAEEKKVEEKGRVVEVDQVYEDQAGEARGEVEHIELEHDHGVEQAKLEIPAVEDAPYDEQAKPNEENHNEENEP